MELDPRFWAGKCVCVTGGTGFLGWHLVRQLLALTPRVRIFGLRPTSLQLPAHLQGLDCVFGDVRDPGAVREAVRNCQIVFHTAGTVAVWGPALKQMREIHVVGTRQILHALPPGARLVHTSSVVAIGASRGPEILTEASPFNLQPLQVDYVHAKKAAEDVALVAAAAKGTDVVVVNPAYLIGPEDYERSIMGRFCLRFWKGKVPLIPPGALNFVDVRDVARGHLLAAERGRRSCRYILGGENRTMWELAQVLAGVRGMSVRWRFRLPAFLQTVLAWCAECGSHYVNREPYPSRQFARMCRYRWQYSSARAGAELGYQARSLQDSLIDAHQWFCDHGWLKPNNDAIAAYQSDVAKRSAA
jgi:dihydroflavonol-4-reductase